MHRSYPLLLFFAGMAACGVRGQEIDPSLPAFSATGYRVANPEPAGTFGSPVSQLAFEPRVDLQARNLPEAQGDVSIRGGIFENTGFRLGAVTLFDPQTGHYFAEIPVPPAMLEPPQVLTGTENASRGFNSSVGTLQYDWRPIETGGSVRAGLGEHDLALASARSAWSSPSGQPWALEASGSLSQGNGGIADGDHEFERVAARAAYASRLGTSTLFAGYQAKRFQWPFLYAVRELHGLVGSSGIESENLQTTLLAADHIWQGEDGRLLQLTAYGRKNRDDYEFDVTQPGLFNPFEHETEAWAFGTEARWPLLDGPRGPALQWRSSAQITLDRIDSTSLTFGPFQSRAYFKAGFLPRAIWTLADNQRLVWDVGLAFDATDRLDDEGTLSPLVRVAWESHRPQGPMWSLYAEYAEASQVPGYTALGGNPNGGLFRGNPNLDRETSRNLEAGGRIATAHTLLETAAFFRQDDDLVDWTFDSSAGATASRFARNVDIETFGIELIGAVQQPGWEIVASYTFLEKEEDYGALADEVDASFYALNFPRHRLTAALILAPPPLQGLELRWDNEYRIQEPNVLREGGDSAWLSTLSVAYAPPRIPGLELLAIVDNLANTRFQEVPGVPGAGRQITLSAAWRW